LGTVQVAASSQAQEAAPLGSIVFQLVADPSLGAEGYELKISPQGVVLSAPHPAGLFYGVQTLRQLLPPVLASGELALPGAAIRDYPRFAWRGAMLDVARHFFGPADIKRYIDLLAYYKINRLHLHLTDDQGWRLMIESWPRLAEYGGLTAVNGDPGGYYTQAEYRDLVAYASQRFITLIPEIDLPGHTNAALASYAELNCDGVAPALYTGIEVGFSSLCLDRSITAKFLDEVIGELASLTPGDYLHIGGDEARSTSKSDYIAFIEMIQTIVTYHGKTMVGWNEISQASLQTPVVVQFWSGEMSPLPQNAQVIASPASYAYLDMKYDKDTVLGLDWAGIVSVRKAYEWEPADMLGSVSEDRLLGVEAPLWSETVKNLDQVTFLAFPRLLGHAEIGWSPRHGRSWPGYAARLAAHGPRLAALGVNFCRAPEITWLSEANP
jgi:hexosaminidase